MKGPAPDPGAAARGTEHKHRPNQVVPAGHDGVLTPAETMSVPMPRQLPRTKPARMLWHDLLAEVARVELRPGDLPLVEACCVAKWRSIEAGLFVKKWGMMVRGGPDGMKLNPALAEERAQAMLYDRLAQRLSLSPEARVRLNIMKLGGMVMLSSMKSALQDSASIEGEASYPEDEIEDAELDD